MIGKVGGFKSNRLEPSKNEMWIKQNRYFLISHRKTTEELRNTVTSIWGKIVGWLILNLFSVLGLPTRPKHETLDFGTNEKNTLYGTNFYSQVASFYNRNHFLAKFPFCQKELCT